MEDTFETFTNSLREEIDQFTINFKNKLLELFSKLFIKHPDIKCIYWRQYTPYFNDGDACVFSIGGLNWDVQLDYELYEMYDIYVWEEDIENKEHLAELQTIADSIRELAGVLNKYNQYLKAFFGDNTEVRITSDLTQVELIEYTDHD